MYFQKNVSWIWSQEKTNIERMKERRVEEEKKDEKKLRKGSRKFHVKNSGRNGIKKKRI